MAPESAARPTYEHLARWFPASGDLLDVGCGAGGLLAFAKERGMRVVGLDRDPDNVAHARSRGLAATVSDALAPDLPDAVTFDVVTIVHLVEHFGPDDALHLISVCAERVRPGGHLLLVTPNILDRRVESETFWLDPTHVQPYTADELAEMVTGAGLSVVSSSTELLVRLGRRSALLRPLGKLRHGREHDRPNLVIAAVRPAAL